MSEAGILISARAVHPLAYRGNHSLGLGVRACATCKGYRDVGEFDRDTGLCHACLDRSRIDEDDDLGGEG
jgi:hypothetical protein